MTYDGKQSAKIERLKNRIEKLRVFANGKDFSLFNEDNSGIPLGQPILIGHHSERRHRRHLERLENLMRKGFEASALADRLEEKLERMVNGSNRIIQVDNPDAKVLIEEKIASLQSMVDRYKSINAQSRKGTLDLSTCTEDERWMLDRYGKIPSFSLTNANAEIRRLKKRLVELERISEGFESFTINGVTVSLIDGQVRVVFPGKPNETTRNALKRSPIALKWSGYSKAWVRKHTATTAGAYFKTELMKVLEVVAYE